MVGLSVTRMKAKEDVNAAGPASVHGSSARLAASAMRIGRMIVLVTVLLEKKRCSNATPSTMRNGRKIVGTSPIRPILCSPAAAKIAPS